MPTVMSSPGTATDSGKLNHIKLEYVQIEKLKGWKDNPRVMPADQMRALVGSIERFGIVDPIIVNQKNLVIGGHQRVEAGKSLGLKEVPVIRVKVSEREMKTLNLALNRISREWDEAKLTPILAELDASLINRYAFQVLKELDKTR